MRTTLILTATAVLLVGLAAIAVARPDGAGWHGDNAAFGPGGHRGGGRAMLFQRFDTDGDGRVTRAEVDTYRADGYARFDANGDGTLSIDEFEPFWLEFARPRMVDRFQALDADGDGQVTEAEFERPINAMFTWGDRDGDGALSPDDMRRHSGPRSGESQRN